MTNNRTFPRALLILGLCLGLAACKSPEERAAEYVASAEALIAQGDTPRAILELRNALEFAPTHVEAHRSLAELLAQTGEFGAAYQTYLQLAELKPDDLPARLALSELTFEAREWEEFERHGTQVLELGGSSARANAVAIALEYRSAAIAGDPVALEVITERAEEAAAAMPEGNSILEDILLDSYMRRGDLDIALVQLDAKIARSTGANPAPRAFYDQRLAILSEIGTAEEIETHLRTVVGLFDEDDAAKGQLVRFLVSQDMPERAEAFLRDISDPADADLVNYLSLVEFLRATQGVEAAIAELEAGLPTSSAPDRLRLVRAMFDYERGRQDAAITALQDVLSARETTAAAQTEEDADAEAAAQSDMALTNDLRIALARMLGATGDRDSARGLVDEVLAADAENVAGLKIRAAYQISQDDADAAIGNLRRALANDPEDLQAYQLMAEAYNRLGSRDLARDFLAQAVDISDNAPDPSLRYARVLQSEGNLRAAEEVLLPALRQAPGNQAVLQLLADIYLETGEYERVSAVAREMRRSDQPAAQNAANRLETALLARREGTQEALSFLEGLATGAEAGLAERLLLLRAHLASNQPEAALSVAQTLVDEAPGDPDRLFWRAMTRGATGDLETALRDMQDLVAASPERARFWRELYRLTGASEGPEAASAVLSEALVAVPDAPMLLWAQAGERERAGDIDGAIEVYEALYARNTSSVVFANNLASLLSTYRSDQDSIDRAWAIARRLRDTDVPAFQDTYGWLAFKRGDFETALPYLQSAAAGLPQDPIVQYHLARTYEALESPAEALAAYERALEAAQDGDARAQILEARSAVTRLQDAANAAPSE